MIPSPYTSSSSSTPATYTFAAEVSTTPSISAECSSTVPKRKRIGSSPSRRIYSLMDLSMNLLQIVGSFLNFEDAAKFSRTHRYYRRVLHPSFSLPILKEEAHPASVHSSYLPRPGSLASLEERERRFSSLSHPASWPSTALPEYVRLQLRSLKVLSLGEVVLYLYRYDVAHLFTLFANCHSLKTLEVSAHPIPRKYDEPRYKSALGFDERYIQILTFLISNLSTLIGRLPRSTAVRVGVDVNAQIFLRTLSPAEPHIRERIQSICIPPGTSLKEAHYRLLGTHFPALSHLSLRSPSIGDPFFQFLVDQCPRLVRLDISEHSPFLNRSLIHFCTTRDVVRLHLSYFSGCDPDLWLPRIWDALAIRPSQLQEIHVEILSPEHRASFINLLTNRPPLRKLSLDNADREILQAIADHCPKLEELRLINNRSHTLSASKEELNALGNIFIQCSNLTQLTVSREYFDSNLSHPLIAQLPIPLRRFRIHYDCHISEDSIRKILIRCPHLESVSIRIFEPFTPVFLAELDVHFHNRASPSEREKLIELERK